MSEAQDLPDQTPSTATLGVVDPIRVPGLEPARRFWNRLPLLGRVFLVVAPVDLVVRLLGIPGLESHLEIGLPIAIFSSFLPHYAMLLFPVVVLARRPDAATATPLILAGAVALALVELLGGPLSLWLSPIVGDITGWTVLQLAIAIARGGAFLALAYGLLAIDRSVPSPTAAGLANLVGGVITVSAIVSVLVQLLGQQVDLGTPEWSRQFLLTGVAGQLVLLAYAYLARAAIRGSTDTTRPRAATTLAAGGMVLGGIDAFLALASGALVLLQILFAISTPDVPGSFGFWFIGNGIVLTLLVVAFGLGLGDASATIPVNPGTKESRA